MLSLGDADQACRMEHSRNVDVGTSDIRRQTVGPARRADLSGQS